jgi:hypothetical protein
MSTTDPASTICLDLPVGDGTLAVQPTALETPDFVIMQDDQSASAVIVAKSRTVIDVRYGRSNFAAEQVRQYAEALAAQDVKVVVAKPFRPKSARPRPARIRAGRTPAATSANAFACRGVP